MSRVRPYSACMYEQDSGTVPQPIRPSTAGSHFKKERNSAGSPSKYSKPRPSSKNQSSDVRKMSIARPISALERTELYKKLLVDSVHRIHCPTLYRALCKTEKKIQLNRKLRYTLAKMLYLAAVRGEFSYDDIRDHLRDSLNVFVSSPESKQLVLYAGIFSTYHQNSGKAIIDEIKGASDIDAAAAAAGAAASGFQEDMRSCVRSMPLSVPPLYCYTKWCKDVKKLESRRHLSSGFFAGAKKHCNARIAVIGPGEGSDCGGSQGTFEEVMAGDFDGLLNATSVVSNKWGSSLRSCYSDDEDDFTPLPAPKKVSKLAKFKKVAYGVMLARPSDETDVLQETNLQRKKGLQYLYESGHNKNPEHQRMIASLIRGELPTKDRPRGSITSTMSSLDGHSAIDPDDDVIMKPSPGGGVGIVATDDIAAGYFTGIRSPPTPSSTTTSKRPFTPNGTDTPSPVVTSPHQASTGGNSSQMSPGMGLVSGKCQSFDSQLDWDDIRDMPLPEGVELCSEERRVIVDSIPSGMTLPETKQRGFGASLRKITIIESSVYAPPTPTPFMQLKVCATVGLAKMHLLGKSSLLKARLDKAAAQATAKSGNSDGKDKNKDTTVTKETEKTKDTEREGTSSEVSPSTALSVVVDEVRRPLSRSGSRGSPVRPTMASPYRSISDIKASKSRAEDDMSPTFDVLNELSVPFVG